MTKCPPICLSYSRLRQVAWCLHSFMQVYGISGEFADYGAGNTEDQQCGVALHAIRAAVGEHCWSSKPRRISDRQYWNDISVKVIAGLPLHRQSDVREISDRMCDRFNLDRDADSYLFEQRMALSWPDFQPCEVGEPRDRFEFTIDELMRKGPSFKLTDLKGGYSRNPTTEEAYDDLQILCYMFCAFQTFPDLQCGTGILDLAAYRNPEVQCEFTRETILTHEIPWEVPDLGTAMLTVKQIIDWCFGRVAQAWERQQFHAEPHNLVCKWCQLPCPKQDTERWRLKYLGR